MGPRSPGPDGPAGDVDPARDCRPLVARIVEAVAEARDGDASMAPIASNLDPDALVWLLESAAVPTTVTFEPPGCRVAVDADGDVVASRIDATEGRCSEDRCSEDRYSEGRYAEDRYAEDR